MYFSLFMQLKNSVQDLT